MDCKINRRLLPVKMSYFFTLASIACLLPYLSIYMKQLGLSASEAAIIYGTMPFLGAFIRPVVGMIADKLHKHKVILMLCCLFSGIFHGALILIPSAHDQNAPRILQQQVGVVCEREHSLVQFCTEAFIPDAWMTSCPQGAFNDSRILDMLDPFANSSTCSLQCEMSSLNDTDSGLCFTPMSVADSTLGNRRDCATNVDLEHSGAANLEFLLDEMNHSLSTQTLDSTQNTWHVCHRYAMSAFLYNGSSYQKLYCLEPTDLNCHLKCESHNEISTLEHYHQQLNCDTLDNQESKAFSKTFWLFLILNFVANVAFAPIFSLIDAMAYDFLGEERGKWGQQRLWGTIGFAVFGVNAGLLMDIYSSKEGSDADDIFAIDYTIAFVMFAILQVAVTIIVSRYKTSDTLTCAQMFNNIWLILRRVQVVALLILVFFYGALNGVMETFLFWHLQTLGATPFLMGLCTTISCLPEIPILFLAGHIIKKLGHVVCLYIVCVAYAVRFLAYSYLTSPWQVLAVEPLQGVTFGLMYAAASSYGSLITPSGMHGTVQGLIGGVHFGFGRGFGSVVGGQVFQAYGAILTFRFCSVLAVLLLVFYLTIQFCISQFGNKGEEVAIDAGDGTQQLQTNGTKPTACKDDPEEQTMIKNQKEAFA